MKNFKVDEDDIQNVEVFTYQGSVITKVGTDLKILRAV